MSSQRSASLRPLISGAAVTASVAATIGLPATDANAQSTNNANARPSPAAADSTVLETITVTGHGAGNSNYAKTGVARLPENVKEITKIVNVVPQKIIEQQRATTLEQVLKNVPGITLSTGEGNGGQNGDQFRIRGLSAKGDIFTDGMRDFGVFARDSFDTESVQVIKGPSGEAFGVGNVGGLINQTTKKAHLGTAHKVDQTFGSGFTARTAIDSNIQIDDVSALRINGMFNKQTIADRKHAKNDRAGIAIDYGTGLGTDTEWHLNYSYLHLNRRPDYGVPFAQAADGIYRPLPEFNIPGLPKRPSYIRDSDIDRINRHTLSSNFKKELESGVVIYNDTRFSHIDRRVGSTNPATVNQANLQRLMAGQNVEMAYGAGGGSHWDQTSWAIQNVTTAKAELELGGLKHRLMGGIDISHQSDKRVYAEWDLRRPRQNVRDPFYRMPGDVKASLRYNGETRDSVTTNTAFFLSDRMWLTDEFSIQGSVRFDHFNTRYKRRDPEAASRTLDGQSTSNHWSPSISAIWEPTEDYMLYASYARSYRPIGTDIAAGVGGVGSEVPSSLRKGHPERSDSYELGFKADFYDKALGLTGAIFQIDKKNAYSVDPLTGEVTNGFFLSGEGKRVRGFELGVTGEITDNWTVSANYAYLNGKTTFSSTPANIGKPADALPRHNVALWTSYDLPENSIALPGTFTLGGGFQYASSYWSNTANTAKVPDSFSLDAMVAYKQDNVTVSLNAYNLTDHKNYASSFSSSRIVPASGRTFMVNIGASF